MLLRFHFANFRSFQEEQEFSMVASSAKERSESLIHSDGIDEAVLPVSAVYGANASGKSNLFHAFRFMVDAVRYSHSRWEPDGGVPREPFAGASEETASSFLVDFVDRGVRYQYGFSVSSEIVLEEWLYAFPKGKRQAWFTRTTAKPMSFSEKMPGENRMIEGLTRPNSLFLSAAAQNNHSALSAVYRWFSRSIDFVIDKRLVAEICAAPQYRATIVRMLALADLGIADLKVKERGAVELFFNEPSRIQLVHRIGEELRAFDEAQESEGTVAYLALLVPMIVAIETAGIVCIDELDASLHPLLAVELIRLFSEPASNPKGAQLIFNTHDTNLLSSGLLRRDQIWFAEKRPDGRSEIYPLSDFKPRKEENLENGYLQGRYGAIPFLNPEQFLLISADAHEKAR